MMTTVIGIESDPNLSGYTNISITQLNVIDNFILHCMQILLASPGFLQLCSTKYTSLYNIYFNVIFNY